MQVCSNSYKSTSKLSNRFKNLSSRLNSKLCCCRNWSMITDSCSSSGTSHARTWCRCSTSIVTSLSSSKAGLTKHLNRSIRSIWSRLSNFNSNSPRRWRRINIKSRSSKMIATSIGVSAKRLNQHSNNRSKRTNTSNSL